MWTFISAQSLDPCCIRHVITDYVNVMKTANHIRQRYLLGLPTETKNTVFSVHFVQYGNRLMVGDYEFLVLNFVKI